MNCEEVQDEIAAEPKREKEIETAVKAFLAGSKERRIVEDVSYSVTGKGKGTSKLNKKANTGPDIYFK